MRRKKTATTIRPPITLDMKVYDLIETYPEALDALIEIGFEPLKSAVARNTVAKLFTIEQAAAFRGISPEEMMDTISRTVGIDVYEDDAILKHDNKISCYDTVPDLKGDISFMGLVPCPIRNILMEKFDGFTQKLTAATGKTVAWWMAGEGTGTNDVRPWISKLVKEEKLDVLPDILYAVGTEIFMQKRYGKYFYDKDVWGPAPKIDSPRQEMKKMNDPEGKLSLMFSVLFAFSCRTDRLKPGGIPRTWADLAKPEFHGEVAFPTLNLPIVADLLSALYHYLGDEQFRNLASNIHSAMHPSQSSPRKRVQDVPGVVIIPLHFTKLASSTGAIEIIPEDGPVAVPSYLALRKDAGKEAISVVEFLQSKDYMELFWKFGTFLPNRSDIDVNVKFNNLITRPWEDIIKEDTDEFSDWLLQVVESGGVV
ncbi:ABC transporter substrate-binding protein [Bacteroidota bacterium]